MSKSDCCWLTITHCGAGLRMLFLAEPDMAIVGEAAADPPLSRRWPDLRPDVVLMDVAMPGMSGIEATRRIKEASPETAILALTMYEEEQYFSEMSAGVRLHSQTGSAGRSGSRPFGW